jgi:hypothetical protein
MIKHVGVATVVDNKEESIDVVKTQVSRTQTRL